MSLRLSNNDIVSQYIEEIKSTHGFKTGLMSMHHTTHFYKFKVSKNVMYYNMSHCASLGKNTTSHTSKE